MVEECTYLVYIFQTLAVAVGISRDDIARLEFFVTILEVVVGHSQSLDKHTGSVGLGGIVIDVVLLADITVVKALVGSTQLVIIR